MPALCFIKDFLIFAPIFGVSLTLVRPVRATKDLLGQTHIYLESLNRSAFTGTIFNSKFQLEICLIFLLMFNVSPGE